MTGAEGDLSGAQRSGSRWEKDEGPNAQSVCAVRECDDVSPQRTLWEVRRVRAGPLVKELRMIRPRASPLDTPEDTRDKNFIRRYSALIKDPTDRLELRLALFGWEGAHYTLKFDDLHLPDRYAGVLAAFRAFVRRCKRRRAKNGQRAAFPYVKCIEGIHGDHRWHVHFVCDGGAFDLSTIQELWGQGLAGVEPVLRNYQGYRRLARYFRKERLDGVRLPLDKQPLSWSADLKLPEIERGAAETGVICVPPGCLALQQPAIYRNQFGGFSYSSWLVTDNSRACARARSTLQCVGNSRPQRKKGGESR